MAEMRELRRFTDDRDNIVIVSLRDDGVFDIKVAVPPGPGMPGRPYGQWALTGTAKDELAAKLEAWLRDNREVFKLRINTHPEAVHHVIDFAEAHLSRDNVSDLLVLLRG